jgi:glycine/D-amino acid oxidase-like deaminating enzyme
MLELSLAKGLNLQTNTPALAVTPVSDGTAKWQIETDRSIVRAERVVLATNAYTNALYSSIANTGFLMPSRSQVTAVRPVNNFSGHPPLRKSVAVDDRGSGHYFIIRAPGLKGEGDVLYGGGRGISKTREMGITDDSTVNEEMETYLQRSVPEVFGRESRGGKTEEIRDWTGIACYTPNVPLSSRSTPSKNSGTTRLNGSSWWLPGSVRLASPP